MIYKLELTFLLGQNYGFYEPPMASLDTITSKPSDCEYGVMTNSRFKTASSPNLKNVYIESNVYFKNKLSDEEKQYEYNYLEEEKNKDNLMLGDIDDENEVRTNISKEEEDNISVEQVE